MRRRLLLISVLVMLLAATAVSGSSLSDRIQAAESDIAVFCPVLDAQQIQWSALLYLNQRYGADIHIAVIKPSPFFGCRRVSSPDGQIHLAYIGRPGGMTTGELADSVAACVFNGGYPDIAIFAAETPDDSGALATMLHHLQQASLNDTTSITRLRRVYCRGESGQAANVVLNDDELYRSFANKIERIGDVFGLDGPMAYTPQRFRWYYMLGPADQARSNGRMSDFISGLDNFRMPDIIQERLYDGPERKNLLSRLNRFRSYMRASQNQRLGRVEQLRLLLLAYAEITRLVQAIESGTGDLAATRVAYRAKMIRYKTSLAVTEAVGIHWSGRLQIRRTPFGRAGKLNLDVELAGSLPIELSFFRFHPSGGVPIAVDSISTIIQPHQKLHREYPVDISELDFSGERGDSLLFSIEVIIEGLSMDLFVPYREFGDEIIGMTWLPGYAVLAPFTEGSVTALAQPFDWQLRITKPYDRRLTARLIIETPDGVVVGSYNKDIDIPEGVTTRYIDIHLAAGRSVGYDTRRVSARLESGNQVLAIAAADARIVRCSVPETRTIAFVADSTGQLEDFLRMSNVAFQPFTPHSLVRASLDAYDLIIIGTDPSAYREVLRAAGERLRTFVANGGEILILGQSFGWPYDIFAFQMYPSQTVSAIPARVTAAGHDILKSPYAIDIGGLIAAADGYQRTWPVIMGAGTEIIAAGELGSYLKVSKRGDGHIIYCGLPLLDMAADLNVEAIHLIANLLNFGHGY